MNETLFLPRLLDVSVTVDVLPNDDLFQFPFRSLAPNFRPFLREFYELLAIII